MSQNKAHAAPEVLPEMPQWLEGLPIGASAEDLPARTRQRLLYAETEDEILADPETKSIEDILGHVITISGFTLIPSTGESELGWYAILDVHDNTTNENLFVSCGGTYVLMALANLYKRGYLPTTVTPTMLISKNNSNRSSLWLVKPKRKPVQAVSTAPVLANGTEDPF